MTDKIDKYIKWTELENSTDDLFGNTIVFAIFAVVCVFETIYCLEHVIGATADWLTIVLQLCNAFFFLLMAWYWLVRAMRNAYK